MRKLELLAPAKNKECGIAAIDCGADAVYIGAPRFGARAAAGNSIEDIQELVDYAHQFGVKVYVTLNTIIYDSELDDVKAVVEQINQIGVDAILVQDMALLAITKEARWSGALHASTQTDNRNAEKVGWLNSLGFSRVVLARELSLEEIRTIHDAYPDVELEDFVHGALCVSYSGACYASQYCFGRSANRGECAQFCRMKFDLLDAEGNEIEHQRHLLSLKDLCQIDRLEQLADAGVISFKIEGRLKDASYVKNVVAAYSQRLNQLCDKRPDEYQRASFGKVTYAFEPNLKKTFNRGYTHYFLDGRKSDIFSPDTPKAIGEYVGKVKEIRGRSFNVAGMASFANGDGLCFINRNKELEGFRVNRVEGNRLFPLQIPTGLVPGMALYRNNDEAFEKELIKSGTVRKIPIRLKFSLTEDGFALSAYGKSIVPTTIKHSFEHQKAMKPQAENIAFQLSKWGGTIYEAETVDIEGDAADYFVPSSVLSQMRQALHLECVKTIKANAANMTPARADASAANIANVSNQLSREFYETLEMNVSDAMEVSSYSKEELNRQKLMQCRHCLRYSLGFCVKRGGRRPEWKEPLTLRLGDGHRFRLQFDCTNCQMNIFPE